MELFIGRVLIKTVDLKIHLRLINFKETVSFFRLKISKLLELDHKSNFKINK